MHMLSTRDRIQFVPSTNTSSPPSAKDNIRVSLRASEARTQKLRGKKAFSRIGLSRCKKALSHRSRLGTAVMNDNAVFPQKYVHRGAHPRLVASTLIYSAASRRISDIRRFLFTTFAARCKNSVRKITSLCSSAEAAKMRDEFWQVFDKTRKRSVFV